MSYWLLRQDAGPECWKALVVKQVGLGPLLAGAPLHGIEEPVRIILAADGNQASDFLELPSAVVSDKMRRALEQAGVNNIQYFRASLENPSLPAAVSGYWLANIIGKLSCVDLQASQFDDALDHDVGTLRSFQIDERLSYGLGLFRIAEDPRLIVVRQRVRDVLESAQLRGVLFQAPQRYDGGTITRDDL